METPYAMYDALSAIDVPPEKIRVVVQSMGRDLALYATQSRFSAPDQRSGSRFELLRAEIAALREQLGYTHERFEQVDKRFDLVDRRFDTMRREINESLQAIEQRLIVRLGSFMAVAVVVTAGLVKLLSG